MVQPLSPVIAGGRPDCAPPGAVRKPITTGKYEEFRNHLRKISDGASGSSRSPEAPETTVAQASPTGPQMSAGREAPASLAPEDQPSLGRGGVDPAELFSLINPGGGVEATAAVPVQPAQPGVAGVAELVERWVRRIALGGDHRRGAVRLDIGQGRFAGAEVLVVAEAGHVSVELQLPASLVEGDLSERLRSRLERRGYAADVVVR